MSVPSRYHGGRFIYGKEASRMKSREKRRRAVWSETEGRKSVEERIERGYSRPPLVRMLTGIALALAGRAGARLAALLDFTVAGPACCG